MATQGHLDPLQTFQQANEGRGQICHRTIKVGGQSAVVGIDTGCVKCTISQHFLDKFIVPSEFKKQVNAEIDNGGPTTIKATESILLPINFKQASIATDWVIMPRLAAPLDSLISWSWAVKMKLVIDCEANSLDFKGAPPATVFASPDFHFLQLLPQAGAAITPMVESNQSVC